MFHTASTYSMECFMGGDRYLVKRVGQKVLIWATTKREGVTALKLCKNSLVSEE